MVLGNRSEVRDDDPASLVTYFDSREEAIAELLAYLDDREIDERMALWLS
jgi:hypothetical protein